MHVETLMLVGWVTVPMIAYGLGIFATRVDHSRLARRAIDPAGRLEELRQRQAGGQRVVRGRMAEAMLLAESAAEAVVATSAGRT